MNIWSTIEEKMLMIIQISFSNDRNEGLSVPRKLNLCTFSAEWFSWTEAAKESYNEIEEFLIVHWNLQITQDFIFSVKQIMGVIKIHPHCFQKWEHDSSYFKGIINSKISFFYKVEKDEIVVHLFWNNLQNPENLEEELK